MAVLVAIGCRQAFQLDIDYGEMLRGKRKSEQRGRGKLIGHLPLINGVSPDWMVFKMTRALRFRHLTLMGFFGWETVWH
jgi:hypothetical protein